MTSSLLVQDQTQKRLALRHHRFVTIATAVKKRVAQCAGEVTKHLWISEGWWYIVFFSSLISTQFLFLSHWFYGFENIPVCNYPNLNVIPLSVFIFYSSITVLSFWIERLWWRLFVNMWFGWGHGWEIQWSVLTPQQLLPYRSHLSGRNVNGADPIGAMNETWKSLIRSQKTIIYQ